MTKKFGIMTGKLVVVIQILALTLLASCAAADASANVCHATGDPANPYEEITIDSTELLNEHRVHSNDIFPVPVGGCPASTVVIMDGKVTLCHATNSRNNPYNGITVSVNGLNGHGGHAGDIFPVSEEEGCPANLPSGGMITICHATGSEKNPYSRITVNANGLNGHDKHAGDIIPAPAGGCPTTRP